MGFQVFLCFDLNSQTCLGKSLLKLLHHAWQNFWLFQTLAKASRPLRSGRRSPVWRMASHLCSSEVGAPLSSSGRIKCDAFLSLSISRKEVVTKQTEGYSQQQQEEEEEILIFQVLENITIVVHTS